LGYSSWLKRYVVLDAKDFLLTLYKDEIEEQTGSGTPQALMPPTIESQASSAPLSTPTNISSPEAFAEEFVNVRSKSSTNSLPSSPNYVLGKTFKED
jgi:hypothetical protein